MEFKIVYIVISGEDDYIPEQAFLSMVSLRRHNPQASVTLVTDAPTLGTLSDTRARLLDLTDEIITASDIPSNLSPGERNHFIKTSLRRRVKGDFLYLDNDTLVMAPLSDLADVTADIAGVLDLHSILYPDHHGQLKKYLKITGKPFWNYPKYFNGGILFARDTAAAGSLFEQWHLLWNEERLKYGVKFDQPALAQVDAAAGGVIREIDGTFNCQITHPRAVPFLMNAKIVHYFSNSGNSSLFPLTQPRLLEEVRRQGLTVAVEEVLRSPQTAFLRSSLIICGDELRYGYNSPFMILSRRLIRTFPFLNSLARGLYRLKGARL